MDAGCPRGAERPRRDLVIHPADLQCQEDPADRYQGKARQTWHESQIAMAIRTFLFKFNSFLREADFFFLLAWPLR